MSDLVSVITPCYNAEKYIEKTIESVLQQNYAHWEMLIIDDSSTDSSTSIVKKYVAMDKRIKLIELEKNSGVAMARNMGIKLASGRYIALLDSDDLWVENKLTIQIEFMKKNNHSFTFGEVELINDKGVKLGKKRKVTKKATYKSLLKGNIISCLTVVIDRKAIEDLEMPNVKHEDYATWLNLLRNGNVAYGIEEKLGYYRILNNSVSSNKLKTLKWTWNIFYCQEKIGLLKSIHSFTLFVLNTSFKYIKS